MTLDPMLLEILACPEDKGPLLWFADEHRLYNDRLRRSYEVRDGIPVMLIDEAVTVDEAEHQRLMAKAAAEQVPRTMSGSGEGAGAGGAAEAGGDGPAGASDGTASDGTAGASDGTAGDGDGDGSGGAPS